MNKAILLNGSRLCGKDSAINYLKQQGVPLVIREAKDSLHKLTQMLFCVPEERYWEIYNDRSLKEKPLNDFRITLIPNEYLVLRNVLGQEDLRLQGFDGVNVKVDLSVRQAMIYVSEVICKPRWGANYFGESRTNLILDGEIIVDGSCGFKEELPPLIAKLGQKNILLIRVHRDGCTFAGDSRSLIEDGVINNTVDVYNNGLEQDYLDNVYKLVKEFLNE